MSLTFAITTEQYNDDLPRGGGVAALSSPGGGSGCCGNSEAGIPAPGKTGKTGGPPGLAPGWAWPSMAERTAGWAGCAGCGW